jgi:hypothetical protein
MSEIIQVADLEKTKFHNTFHVEAVTGKEGGLAGGADIDYTTNAVTGQVQKTLPKILADIDWSYVGLFADGVTFTKRTDFALDASGIQWAYVGTYPFTATAGTVPSEPLYQVVHVGSLQNLSGLTAPSPLDTVYDRSFENVTAMIAYSGHEIGLRYSTGRTAWEVNSAAGVDLGGGLFAKSLNEVSPVDFGADRAGIANATTSFTDAANAASDAMVIQFGDYRLDSYELSQGQNLITQGSTIRPVDNTKTCMVSTAKNDWSITGKSTFHGNRETLPDITNTGEIGLKVTAGVNQKLNDVTFKRFKGVGYQTVDAAFTYYGNKIQGNNLLFLENIIGAKLGSQYHVYTNMSAVGNELGIESIGGNLVWIGGNCTDNTDGFKITDGPNNAHGIAVGIQFNHNKNRNILIDKTRLGHTFSACHSYANDAFGAGKIEIVQSAGVDFIGGTYDCEFYLNEFLGINEDNYLRNAYLPGDYGPSGVKSTNIYNQYGNRSTSMRVSGCVGPGAINAADGYNINDISPCAYSVKRLGSSPQALITGVETTLTFNVLGILGDIRGNISPLGAGQGVFPTVIDGYYTCELGVVLAGTTFDAEASYIVLVVDDEPISYESGKSIGLVGGKQGFKYSFSISEYATNNIKFVAYAVGTDLVHGIGAYHSRAFVNLIQK